jgi:hypothetical protein
MRMHQYARFRAGAALAVLLAAAAVVAFLYAIAS